MTWAKIDDRFPRNPKAMAAGPVGRDLFVGGLCYCNEHLTDGFIPRAAVSTLAPGNRRPEETAKLLVSLRLWEEIEGGYRVHNFHTWNPTATEIRAARDQKRQRQERWRNRQRDASPNPFRDASDDASLTRLGGDRGDAPPTPTPTPTPPLQSPPVAEPEAAASHGGGVRVAGFERFYAAYPRHEAKQAALEAWRTLRVSDDLSERIFQALAAHKRRWKQQATPSDKIPLPGAWLTGRRWEDELPAPLQDPYASFPRAHDVEDTARMPISTTRLSGNHGADGEESLGL